MASTASSSGGGGLFSTLTSFFGGSGPSSSSGSRMNGSGGGNRNKPLPSSFGGGFQRRVPGASDGAGADDWSLPYTQYGGGPGAGMNGGGAGASSSASPYAAYPPSRGAPNSNGGAGLYGTPGHSASLAEFTNAGNPNGSTSHLVANSPTTKHSSFARLTSSFGVAVPRSSFLSSGGAHGSSQLPTAGGAGGGSAVSSHMPASAYPPLRHTWRRIRAWCRKQYPELWDTVNYPALEAELDEYEARIGAPLPPAVRESLLLHNGQELEAYANSAGGGSCADGLFFGMPMLSVEQSMQEWGFWRAVDDDPETGASIDVRANMSSCPEGWVRTEYSNRGWIPLISDRVGNYIGVDLNPPPPPQQAADEYAADADAQGHAKGASGASTSSSAKGRDASGASGCGYPGQVIVFGRDFDTKVVLWRGEGQGGWGRFLQHFAEELEAGELWTLDDAASTSEDDEDAIGYEGYFGGAGSGAGGKGGGDRGGDGHAGFRLHGDYKGWPVLEAWADRSIRAWEDAGYHVGPPAGQDPGFYAQYGLAPPDAYENEHELGPPPELQVHPSDAEPGPSGASASTAGAGAPPLIDPLSDAAGSSSAAGNTADAQQPLQQGEVPRTALLVSDSAPGTPTLGVSGARRSSATLSPPPPASFKGKERAGGSASSVASSNSTSTTRRKPIPPPAPATALDLPTLDDVRAAHAAALAEAGRGGSHRFELDQSIDLATHGHGAAGARGSGERSCHAGALKDRRQGSSGSALRDVIVDPASMSPRPSMGGGDTPISPRFGPASPYAYANGPGAGADGIGGAGGPGSGAGTPRLAPNPSDSYAALLDPGSQPGSPALGFHPLKPGGSSTPQPHSRTDSPQPSPLLVQAFAGASLNDDSSAQPLQSGAYSATTSPRPTGATTTLA